MDQLTKRRIGIVVGVLILVGAYAGMNFLASQKEAPPKKEKEVRLKQVKIQEVQNESIPTTLAVQGQLVAFNKIDIFSEVTGTLLNTSRPFKVGTYFPKGRLMIQIDDQEPLYNLSSQKSNLLNSIATIMADLKIDYPESFPQWESYLNSFDPEAPIKALPSPVNEAEKRFLASRNLFSQFYSIKSAEERLTKYRLYAPFSGVLTQTSINPGAVVRAGQKLGELMQNDSYELVATVPLSELSYIKLGNKVQLQSTDLDQEWTGSIRRISDQIDPNSQTVQVFIGVRGKNLREGMYLNGTAAARTVDNAYRLKRDLLVDQGAVYLVKDSVLDLQKIELVQLTRDYAIVKGLKEGSKILSEPIPSAYDGMPVQINKSRKDKESDTAVSTKSTEAAIGSTK